MLYHLTGVLDPQFGPGDPKNQVSSHDALTGFWLPANCWDTSLASCLSLALISHQHRSPTNTECRSLATYPAARSSAFLPKALRIKSTNLFHLVKSWNLLGQDKSKAVFLLLIQNCWHRMMTEGLGSYLESLVLFCIYNPISVAERKTVTLMSFKGVQISSVLLLPEFFFYSPAMKLTCSLL